MITKGGFLRQQIAPFPLLPRLIRRIIQAMSTYFVVNASRTSRDTHIMESSGPWTPGMASSLILGVAKWTLCDLRAARYAGVFRPQEASCPECRRRWMLAVDAEVFKTDEERECEANNTFMLRALIVICLLAAAVAFIVTHG